MGRNRARKRSFSQQASNCLVRGSRPRAQENTRGTWSARQDCYRHRLRLRDRPSHAEEFAKEGADVVVTYPEDQDGTEETRRRVADAAIKRTKLAPSGSFSRMATIAEV